jgi:hypothetical protein
MLAGCEKRQGMTVLDQLMKLVFVLAWSVAAFGWIYGTRYWLGMWRVRFDKSKRSPGYMRKALVGYGTFVAAIAVGFAAGGIAEFWGEGLQ